MPLELGRLLPSTSPTRWREAVLRAGQLLAPGWAVAPVPATPGALALVLYAVSADTATTPEQVTLAEVTALLDAAPDLDQEPATTRLLIHHALESGGHPIGDRTHPASRTAARLLHRDEPLDIPLALGGGVAGPSALRYALPRLRALLAGLTEEQLSGLPSVEPIPVEASAHVTGAVKIVTSDSWLPLGCPVCRRAEGATVAVDGDLATFTCRKRHTTTDHQLGARHVHTALTRTSPGGKPVRGDLYVVHPDQPADADPRQLCVWLRAPVGALY